MMKVSAPYLRKWHNEESERVESGFYRKRRSLGEMFWVWLIVVVAATAALVMERHHRSELARQYRALPSADERLLSADYPLTRVDHDAELTAAVERSWREIVGPAAAPRGRMGGRP